MIRALAAAAALLLSSEAHARQASAGPARHLRLDRGEAGVGRCTSDGACSFTGGDGRTVRAAGVVSRGTGARAVKKARPRAPIAPVPSV